MTFRERDDDEFEKRFARLEESIDGIDLIDVVELLGEAMAICLSKWSQHIAGRAWDEMARTILVRANYLRDTQ